MINKKYLWIIFSVMVAAQIFVPAQMIWTSENTIAKGRIWNFKTVPVDPVDPFRGKYIRLRYEVEQRSIPVAENMTFDKNQKVYGLLEEHNGYADIYQIIISPPKDGRPYISVTTRDKAQGSAYIEISFDKYFMEESLAKPAEDAVRAMRNDSTNVVYAKVSVLNGEAVLQDVMVNDQTIAEYVRERR